VRKSAAGAAIRESFTEKSLSGFLLLGRAGAWPSVNLTSARNQFLPFR
jgi:hypothetical protein